MIAAGPHAQYQRQLTCLAEGAEPLVALLEAATGLTDWTRTYARLQPDAAAYCTVLFEHRGGDIRRADLSTAPTPTSQPAGDLGHAQLIEPAEDPMLDTLPAVFAAHPGARIIRYRPDRRCTLRVTGPDGARFVKVFRNDIGAQLHLGMQALYEIRDELGFAVAPSLGWNPATRAATQAAVPGAPAIADLFGVDGLDVAARMGRAAATLPLCSVTDRVDLPADDQIERTERYTRNLGALAPHAADRVATLSANLVGRSAGRRAREPRPIHGGLHPSQYLTTPDGGLALVDFDRLSVGDPELDVATLITELRYERAPLVNADELCAAFVAGYQDVVELDPELIDLYVAHKELAKVLRLARAPRPDAPARFERALIALEQSQR